MFFVLVLLLGVIVTYWYLTDARRVRAMAENYLAQLTGGEVEVKNATLSIFEGLRLDGVSVRVDDRDGPDSQIFKAGTILIKYNPQSILSGRLEATQIVALDPQVFLTEDLDEGRWNFQRTAREERKTSRRGGGGARMKFPEILLRNAQLTYSRLRNGQLLRDRGLMEIEGKVNPNDDGSLSFIVQSRGGQADAIGPVIDGQFDPRTQAIRASLKRFSFGKDIEVMLPEQVRQWWVAHGLSGSLDIPMFSVTPGRDGGKSKFRIETDLKNVTLDIQPEEWLSRDEGRRLAAMRDAVRLMKDAGLDGGGVVTHVESLFNPSMVELDKVAGRFVFTDDGIDIDRVSGWVEKNPFTINGRIHGYSAQSAASITFEGQNVTIPRAPRYVNSMPPAFRELYDHLKPEGDGSIWVKIDRATPGAKPTVAGRVDVIDGNIQFDEFPYPLRKVTGRVTFGWDEQSQMDRVDVDIRGKGTLAGPNKDVGVAVKGFVGPLGSGDAAFDFWVITKGVTSEPALTNAYPREVREALKVLDAEGKGEFPRYKGAFTAHVWRPAGPKQKWQIGIDVQLDDAYGSLVFFPYPVEHLTGKLHITDERVDLIGLNVRKGDASLNVDGVVRFGKDQPIDPDIKIRARNLPIDKDLLGALPKERRAWLEKLGIAGKLDVEGRIERSADLASHGAKPQAARPEDGITYDLRLALKEGSVFPVDGAYAATHVTAGIRLTPTQLVVTDVHGRRGNADIAGGGVVSFGGPGATAPPGVVITGTARNLLLDDALYKALPPAWRTGWDQAKPEGTVDVDVSYSGALDDAPAPTPSIAGTPIAAPTTKPTDGFRAVIRPVKLAMTPRVIPVRLENVKGEVDIRPTAITLRDVTATRKSGGTIAYSGTVPAGTAPGAAWDLTLSAKGLAIDKELRAGLPPAISKLLESMKVEGKLTAEFSKLQYRADPDPAVDDGQLDFAGTITLADNAFDLGVPVKDATGTVTLNGSARRGKLGGMTGAIELSALNLGGRAVKNFRCDLIKPASEDALRIGKIAGEVAGGAVAGQVDLLFPDQGPSRFGLGLVLRNADVRELAGPGEKDIKGSLTASLALEGNWGDASSRRGRGDVAVVGKDMYRIPLVLGLMQITNLALPISSPFSDAAARYSVEGERVNFEQVELRASNMLMSGSGWLDFKSKKVKMTFVTDNPNAWRIPFITELFQGARQEFMQVQVSGTVQEPKVRGSMMSTFTTTVDEVFDSKGKRGK